MVTPVLYSFEPVIAASKQLPYRGCPDALPFAGEKSQRVFRAVLHAFHTKNTLRAVLPVSRIICYVNIHGTYAFALSAIYAFVFFAFDANQRKITHRLKKHGDRTEIFAERPVVFEYERKSDTYPVIGDIARYERPEHDPFDIADLCKKKGCHKNKRRGECEISDPSDLLSRLRRDFIWEKIQHHCSPAGISAPSAAEYQRPEYLCNSIMYGCRFKHDCKEIIPESLDLHVFMTYQSEIDKHI